MFEESFFSCLTIRLTFWVVSDTGAFFREQQIFDSPVKAELSMLTNGIKELEFAKNVVCTTGFKCYQRLDLSNVEFVSIVPSSITHLP